MNSAARCSLHLQLIKNELLVYNANIITPNIHNNIISCLLLHVSAKICHLQGVYTQILKTP